MGAFCAAINCGNRSERDAKSFYRIPAIPKKACEKRKNLSTLRRQKWIAALKRADLTEKKIQQLRICGDHFISGKPADLKDVNNPDWVPSVNMGYEKKGTRLIQNCIKKNKTSPSGTKLRKRLLVNEDEEVEYSVISSSKSRTKSLLERNPTTRTYLQGASMISADNTFTFLLTNTPATNWIYFQTNEKTLNKENTNVNLVAEQNLFSVKEEFTYQSLLQNVSLIKKPNNFWSISPLSNFIICARWCKNYTCEKRVVIEDSLVIRVYLKEWEINLSELLNITCIDDLSNLLEKVESYEITKSEDLK